MTAYFHQKLMRYFAMALVHINWPCLMMSNQGEQKIRILCKWIETSIRGFLYSRHRESSHIICVRAKRIISSVKESDSDSKYCQNSTLAQFLSSYFPGCLLVARANERLRSAAHKPFNESSVLIWAQMSQGKFDVPLKTGFPSLSKSSIKPPITLRLKLVLENFLLINVMSVCKMYPKDKWGNGNSTAQRTALSRVAGCCRPRLFALVFQ